MLVVKPSNLYREKVHGENFSLNDESTENFFEITLK